MACAVCRDDRPRCVCIAKAHTQTPTQPQGQSMTLPTDSEERKNIPLVGGCLRYFPAALAGVAHHSKLGNDKHNPGQELHWSRGKSSDHADCIVRHLVDLQDLMGRQAIYSDTQAKAILDEASALAWRALALSQELHERYAGAPQAPGAWVD